MIIRIALLLVLMAFALLTTVDLLLWLAIPALPQLLTPLALAMLLSAFAVLLLSGLWLIAGRIRVSCWEYCSAQQRLQRHLWFIQGQQEHVKQLFYFKTLQIQSIHERKRQQLLNTNDKQQLKSLSKVLEKDLLAIKSQISKSAYKQLQQEHALYRKQRDVEALLKLQQKIATQ